MPKTAHGRRMMARMKKRYGQKQGERVYYASVNAEKPGFEGSEPKTRKKVKRRG